MQVTFPKWHTQAREWKAEGKSIPHIAMLLKDVFNVEVSDSRISQVTNDNWRVYAAYPKAASEARSAELAAAKREGREPDLNKAAREARARVRAELGVKPLKRGNYSAEERKLHQISRTEPKEKPVLSMDRFEKFVSNDPAYRTYSMVKIHCSHEGCDREDQFKTRKSYSPDFAAKWFTGRGWSVGRDSNHDTCPVHAKRPNGAMPQIVEAHIPETAQSSVSVAAMVAATPEIAMPQQTIVIKKPVGADLPPIPPAAPVFQAPVMKPSPNTEPKGVTPVDPKKFEMTRSERRIIYAKIEDVYSKEDNGGYIAHWTDQLVADDLGVHVEWVAEIRDENFGPEKNPVDTAKLLAEAEAARHAAFIKEAGELVASATEILAKDKERTDCANHIEKIYKEIDERVLNIEKSFTRFERLDNETVELLKVFNERLTAFNREKGRDYGFNSQPT